MKEHAKQELKRGDLVSHYLYPRQWLAIVLRIMTAKEKGLDNDYKVLVNIIPGTEHINYFRNITGRGWIYRKWLWVPGPNDGRIDEYTALCLAANGEY